MRFRILAGKHTANTWAYNAEQKRNEFVEVKYIAGDVLESESELDKLFVLKFQRVEDDSPLIHQGKRVANPPTAKSTPQAESQATTEEGRPEEVKPNSQEVTTSMIDDDKKCTVWKNGKKYWVCEPGTKNPIHPKAMTKAEAVEFVEEKFPTAE